MSCIEINKKQSKQKRNIAIAIIICLKLLSNVKHNCVYVKLRYVYSEKKWTGLIELIIKT